jgi:hypothetical protein
MDYVSDTHSIVWYFTEDPRLSEAATKAFDGTASEGAVIVPSVVLAEIMPEAPIDIPFFPMALDSPTPSLSAIN